LQPGKILPGGLQPALPPWDALVVDKLQALKMACSWFNSIRKIWGVV
jgi:hypothetical protein